MPKWTRMRWLIGALAVAGCTGETGHTGHTGQLTVELELSDGSQIEEVGYSVTGGDMAPMLGTINTSAPESTASVEIYGIPAGGPFNIMMSATTDDGETLCGGDADFFVEAGRVTDIAVILNCKPGQGLGGVRVTGEPNFCTDLIKVVVAPLQTSIGSQIEVRAIAEDVEGDPIEYRWTGTEGAFANPNAAETTYTCQEPGNQTVTIAVSDDGFDDCDCTHTVDITCVDGSGAGGSGGMAGAGGLAGAGGSAGVGGAGGNGGVSIESMVTAVDVSRYEADLNAVTGVRNNGSAAWQAAQDLCADRLTSLGFTVERQNYGTGVNVIGTLPGQTDTQLIISAHYDAVPNCEGADDNASGVAGALEAARVLSAAQYERTLVVACWDEEERGLIGSSEYASRARAQQVDIAAMYSLEMIGYSSDEPNTQLLPVGFAALFPAQVAEVQANEFRGDFIALVANERSFVMNKAFERYADGLGLPWIELTLKNIVLFSPATADLRRSDHAPFWEQSYPGIMLTDSANFRNFHYHCTEGPDTTDRLDSDFAVKVIKSVVGATAELAVIVP